MHPTADERRQLRQMLQIYPAELMKAYWIGTAVNNVRNDDPSLVDRVV